MKTLLLLMLAFGIFSCTSEDSNQIANTELVGKWNWTKTQGGINAQVNESPATTSKNIQLNVFTDNHFTIIENGVETYSGTYQLTLKKSIYTGSFEKYLQLNKEIQNSPAVLNGIVSISANNNLTIADNNADGLSSEFVKIN